MDLKNLFTIIFLIFSITINSQSIRINEVVASNSTIFDEDGDTPDWIELYNYGSEAISLNNWNISDEENDDEPWVFPEISLLADEYLLIWASSKDRSEINYIRTHVNHGDEFKYIVPNGNNISTADIFNYCVRYLPAYHQLIWEYPERGEYSNNNVDFSWIHISYIEGNNFKINSVSSLNPKIHEFYEDEKTYKINNFTHRIKEADTNLISALEL